MRNIIVHLQTFKAHNEKLKKEQVDQQEINDMLWNITTKKCLKNDDMDEEFIKNS
jgi:hypothetical protein